MLACRQVAADLVQFVKKCSKPGEIAVLVSHNGKNFDNRMLTAEFKRSGNTVPPSWHWLDTLPLARQLLPELARYLDIHKHLEVLRCCLCVFSQLLIVLCGACKVVFNNTWYKGPFPR